MVQEIKDLSVVQDIEVAEFDLRDLDPKEAAAFVAMQQGIELDTPQLTGIEADRAALAERSSNRVSDKGAESEFVRDVADEEPER